LSENILVPKHEVLDEKSAAEVLKQFNVTKNELPKIRFTDPGLKGLNFSIGDVIRITRESSTAGKSYYHRVVIEG